MDKVGIRRLVRERKRGLSEEASRLASAEVCARLLTLPALMPPATVLAYWPLPDELDVRAAVEGLRSRGQRVYLPCVVGDELVFRRYDGASGLVAGPLAAIPEPAAGPPLDVQDEKTLVVIVPGVAFTADGQRLGRGKGYYDRALATMPEAYTVGVAYKCQIFATLPTEPHDRSVNLVVCS